MVKIPKCLSINKHLQPNFELKAVHIVVINGLKNITEKLNPGQSPVFTGDQPVYALSKQIQWLYPDEFKNVVMFMGPLHIEHSFMDAIRDWPEGRGKYTRQPTLVLQRE